MNEWIVKSIEHLLDFSNILNASIAASWMVLAVIVLRFLLKKAPRWIHVALWGLVAVRLLLPFSIESPLSLIPSAETIPHELLRVEGVQLHEPAYLDVVSNPIFTGGASVEIGQTIDRVQEHMIEMTLIWLMGIAVLLIYTITSYWYLRRKVREAVILRDNIFQSENAGSPFVLGIIKPRIYLPYKIEEQTLIHVIAHEQAHIQRKDHWWKPLGFLLLTIHWFNPLMWLGYVLLCRDIELACDEKVIKDIDNEQRADYSQALVACSVKRPMIAACPLAFGEVGVKERVKSVLNYKKPAFWIIAVAVVACIVVAVCFLTNPRTADISLGNIHISWAKTLDLRPNDPVSRDLSTAQLDELKSRLISLKIGKEEPDFAGLTPFYSISAYSSQTGQFLLAGYNYDGKNNALMYKGKYYRINDADFSAYLSNICAGNDVTEAVMVGNAVKWFDCLHGDEMVWDGRREINLDEFPGVTFRWFSEKLEVVTEKETIALYTGMPIWSVYFCDLNGDGKPEICSSISLGSGIIDNRIIVADYANKGVYELSDRGYFDYVLTCQDGQLWAEKRAYMQDEVLESGPLMLRSVIGTDGTATPMLMFGQSELQNRTGTDIASDGSTAAIDALREQYPEYFDLPTGKGLEVYVWQMAQNSYSFGVLSGTNRYKSPEELWNLKGVSAEEMKAILSTYDIDAQNIYIYPWQNPISSFIPEYWITQEGEEQSSVEARRQAYVDNIRSMLFD